MGRLGRVGREWVGAKGRTSGARDNGRMWSQCDAQPGELRVRLRVRAVAAGSYGRAAAVQLIPNEKREAPFAHFICLTRTSA